METLALKILFDFILPRGLAWLESEEGARIAELKDALFAKIGATLGDLAFRLVNASIPWLFAQAHAWLSAHGSHESIPSGTVESACFSHVHGRQCLS